MEIKYPYSFAFSLMVAALTWLIGFTWFGIDEGYFTEAQHCLMSIFIVLLIFFGSFVFPFAVKIEKFDISIFPPKGKGQAEQNRKEIYNRLRELETKEVDSILNDWKEMD